MSEVLVTICCGFEFWGWNHSPEHNGICRNCLAQWKGAKRKKPEVSYD